MSALVPKATPEKNKKCVVCDSEIPRDEKLCCPVCLSPPFGKECVNCGKRIPSAAKLCSICRSYQRWHIFADFAAALPIVSFIALVTAICTAGTYLYDRNSHTNFKLVSANTHVIYLTVWNTGQKPSTLLGGRLHFDSLPIDDVQLNLPDVDVQEGQIVIQKDSRATIALTVPPFLGLRDRGNAYTKADVPKLLKSRLVTLYLNVDESTGDVASPHETFVVDRIQAFILGSMYK